jgi:hypothetical protein
MDSTRASWSLEAPGPLGTITRTGRCGQFAAWASAEPGMAPSADIAAVPKIALRRVNAGVCIVLLLLDDCRAIIHGNDSSQARSD